MEKFLCIAVLEELELELEESMQCT